MLFLHASTLLTPPSALALGFRGMPRASPAGSTAQLCTRCDPRCPWAPRPLPLSHLHPRPNLGKFPGGRHCRGGGAGTGGRRSREMLRKDADAPPRPSRPGGEWAPARAVPGINRSIPPPSPFYNPSAPALFPAYLGSGSPKRGPGRCGRRPKFVGGGRGQIPLELKPPGCAVRAAQPRRSKLTCSVEGGKKKKRGADGEREEGPRSYGLLQPKGGVSLIRGRAPGKRARVGARTGGARKLRRSGAPAPRTEAPRARAEPRLLDPWRKTGQAVPIVSFYHPLKMACYPSWECAKWFLPALSEKTEQVMSAWSIADIPAQYTEIILYCMHSDRLVIHYHWLVNIINLVLQLRTLGQRG